MLHGPEKRREIGRSVLPSTRRKGARDDLAALRRSNRRAVRQDLRAIATPRRRDGLVEALDNLAADLRRYPNADIRYTVSYRRGGDKLGALFRWAHATTRRLPVEERLDAVRRLFDDNLIGRHAISHLEWDDHFRVPSDHEPRWLFRDDHRRRSGTDELASGLRAIAVEVLEHGDHRDFNRWMKTQPTDKGLVRILAGAHDLDAFSIDCARRAAWAHGVTTFAAHCRRDGRRPGASAQR